ncbi:MAG: PEP-CTERM sorting domain-containing protein [Deltaproteobacteria bacterium]|nr:PEP-CTERM sorting domain-containing protein [Deltaproteobacteria bacterium]
MRKFRMVLVVLSVLLAFGTMAYAAPVTDVVQYPTGYFVPDDASKYNSPYYRWYGEDWGWQHNAIAGTFTSATLSISAYDVDWDNANYPEVDEIYAYDNGTMTLLGTLIGEDDTWSYTTFTLGSNFYDDINAGLQVYMKIDVDSQWRWAVTLAKSVISVDGGTIPDPDPNVPEPATLLLLGFGLAGLATLRKKF